MIPESQYFPNYPRAELWSAPDDTSAEYETVLFLHTLVHLIKPQRVLETGTYHGFTARGIAEALKECGGWLDTLEIHPGTATIARKHIGEGMPVTVWVADSQTWEPSELDRYDLLFFDAGDARNREADIRRYRAWANEEAIWVLHDTNDPRQDGLLENLRDDHIISQSCQLPTPRGITIGRFR